MADDRRIWPEPAFVAVVLAVFSVGLAVGWIVPLSLGVHGHRYNAVQMAVTFVARETAALLTLNVLATRYLGIRVASMSLQDVKWRQIALGAALGLITVALSAVLLARFEMRTGIEIFRAAATGTTPWRLALFVVIGVYSPVVQELIFRGLLLQGLLQRTRAWVAVGLSSAIFGLVHAAGGAGSVLDAFLFGIMCGVLYVRFRSLAAPIAAHIAGNSFAMLYLLWAVDQAGR